jgi:alkylation response protein AidB-like acyl-CoA dehydrogenase
MKKYIDEPIFEAKAFNLSKQEKDLSTKARKLGNKKFSARAFEYDDEARFPVENYKDLHEEGFLGICIPKKHGGLGAGFRGYALAAAEIGRYCGATALTWNMHVCSTLWTGALADDLKMSEKMQKEHSKKREIHYKRIIKEGAIYSQPFSEGGGGAAGVTPFLTKATPIKNGWLINGKKIFASLSGYADYYGILCTEKKPDKISTQKDTLYIAIPANAKGVSIVGDWNPLGMRGTISRTLIFKDVFVSKNSSLMPKGKYYEAAKRWPHMFLTLSPTYVGLAQAAIDFTIKYLRGEVPNTPPVKRRMFATKQLTVAEMQIQMENIKTIWFQSISEACIDPSDQQIKRAYATQYTVMEGAHKIAQLAIRTCGGQAMLKSLPLERIFRDSRCGALMLPWTAEICLDRLGKTSLYFKGEKD